MWAKSTRLASSSRIATGRTASAEPTSTARDATASGLEPRLAQALQGEMAEALRQPLPARGGEQVVVREDRRRAPEGLEDLDLHRRVGDVVLAADHVGDAEVDVVDDRGQRVEVGAVLAHQHRVGQRGAIHMGLAADEVGPGDGAVIEPEAPMGAAPLPFQPRPVLVGEVEGRAVVDRRQAAGELALAAELELVRRLVAG